MYAAIYCRKSVNTLQGESIQSQLEHCRACLRMHRSAEDARQARVYRDEGFSGAGLKRPAMQQLLRDIRGGCISCVVCYRLDRISRNVSDFTALMEEFSRYHVGFLCAAESFDTRQPMGRAMLYMASVFAQLERETIGERVRDNMYTLAADGRWLGGKPPFGYELRRTSPPYARTALVPDAETFPLVQQLFEAVLRRGELADAVQLGAALSEMAGCTVNRRFLRRLFTNPVYAAADAAAGEALLRQGYEVLFPMQAHCDRGIMVYGRHPNHPRAENLISAAAGTHPAVCSGRDWSALSDLLRRSPPQNRQPVGILNGILQCHLCGGPMECKRRSGREGQFDYICRTKNRSHGCCCGNLVGALADDAVWTHLAKQSGISPVQPYPFALQRSLAALLIQQASWDGETLHMLLRR